MSSLIQRVKSKLLNPVAIYRFLDAATKSLTIDTKLGGVTGLYDLASSLRSLPSSKVAFFTLPTYPRSEVVPSDIANVLWTQPQDSEIFQSFRNDVPASQSLFAGSASASASPSASANSPSASPAAPSATPGSSTSGPSATSTPAAQPSTAPSAPIPSARTANQNICAG